MGKRSTMSRAGPRWKPSCVKRAPDWQGAKSPSGTGEECLKPCHADKAPQTFRVQKLCCPRRPPHRTGPDRNCRPQRLWQVQPAGIDSLGHGRKLGQIHARRSEEHTSELQSLMRISYAVFCLKKKKINK